MSTAAATTGTASVGLLRLPAGGPFALNIAVPAFTAFSLANRYISVSFKKKCQGPSPVLFETNSLDGSGNVTVSQAGFASQSIGILINPTDTSAGDATSVFSRKVSVEGLTIEFAVDVKAGPLASADLSWRIQGEVLWQQKHGNFTD